MKNLQIHLKKPNLFALFSFINGRGGGEGEGGDFSWLVASFIAKNRTTKLFLLLYGKYVKSLAALIMKMAKE